MAGKMAAGWIVGAILWLSAAAGGCAGHAGVEIAAADAIDALAVETRRALDEYHADLEAADDARERDVVAAFVARVRRDHADETQTDRHAAEFAAALAKIRADRTAGWQRHARAIDNVAVLRETAAGLRRLALDSLRLDDESRRYFAALVDAARPPAPSAAPDDAGRAAANRPQP